MKKGPQAGISPSIVAEIGRKYGRWTVLAYAGTHGRAYAAHFLCRCDCGVERAVKAEYLRKGRSQSCGCLHKEIVAKTFRTHGHSVNGKPTKTYRAWQHMHTRCYAVGRRDYKWYGAKGVTVCQKWHTFEGFLEDMGEVPEGLTLDRIDPYGNYEPSNCRWATWEVQYRNKR